MKPSCPVILVPGITATYLRDEYQLPPETVWKVMDCSQNYERISLHPDDLRYEAKEPARLKPDQVYEVAYKEILEELRYNLRTREDVPVPVYAFNYDWRMPLATVEDELDLFIEEVINRTKLLKHYHKAGYAEDAKVNLVGHSMGGLIITGYLEKKKKSAPVNKVVTLATPFQGSFEAVIKITTGTASLGTTPPSSREREAARITPSLYHLLPSFDNNYYSAQDYDLFDPKNWQPSVLASLEEFIRLQGLDTKNRKAAAEELFAHLLKKAKKHRARTDTFRPADAGLNKEDWLAIVGVDTVTRVGLETKRRGRAAEFIFRSSDRRNEWNTGDHPEKQKLTGDGTVPFNGATPKFINPSSLVCVTPDDFGYWEVQDKALTEMSGFHGILPNMNMLHRMIVRFFTGRPDKHNNTWGRRAPGVTSWTPPLQLTQKSG